MHQIELETAMNDKLYSERLRLPLNILLALVALVVAVVPILLSQKLHKKMVEEERIKMELWAASTEALASDAVDAPLNVLLSIIRSNKTIPIILCDKSDSIISYNNIDLPPHTDSLTTLTNTLADFKKDYPPIVIDLGSQGQQFLYYSDSSTLKELFLFPTIQIFIFVVFVFILLMAWYLAQKNAQNKLWIGLSKETAHQLGTPISSLMAWTELLQGEVQDPTPIHEINKDIERLQTITHRFQKIGSAPQYEERDLAQEITQMAQYMERRISKEVCIFLDVPQGEIIRVQLVPSLWSWVIENLIKNAVDAMRGKGEITITLERRGKYALIDLTDTGKGISPRDRHKVFRPGFTTKKHGWGLGLSLVRRIIEVYHNGRIIILRSEVGIGTTFRIKLPLDRKQRRGWKRSKGFDL